MDARDSVVVIGAGLAGLFLALKLAPRPVTVLSPAPLGQAAASAWAQGGLAAALAPEDAPALHAADTVAAGAGLVDPVVARLIAEEGPARVRDLLEIGVPFDRSPDGSLLQSLEAAHSVPRVVRVSGDLAGKAIMDALITAVRASDHVTVLEGVRARALATAREGRIGGVKVRLPDGRTQVLRAREVVLATGGVGGLFRVTTNPASALGTGLAMAARSGALIADPEFVQFHPTALDVGRDPAPLATEALRGEGALLVDGSGDPLMARHDPRGDLAPRDVVARAIDTERRAGGRALLDCRAAVGAHFPTHFPTVFAACMAAGIDPRVQAIPVAPAAHYHMGGVVTDLWGQTTLAGLSAIGECASTGAHGANRLASNSLLEAIVFAHRVAERLLGDDGHPPAAAISAPSVPDPLPADALMGLRADMAQACGVVRDAAGLEALAERIEHMGALHGNADALVVAGLMVDAALARQESRGSHWREDFPAPAASARRTFVSWAEKAGVRHRVPAEPVLTA
jgi:L-aspartate oxidase